jgi:cobalt-zinc-cadmium efflux system membrane fusion protein
MTADEIARAGVVLSPTSEQDVDDVLITSGRVAFDEARVAHMLSAVNGRVVRIDGNLGDHVRKGQVLALLSSPDLGAATADLSKARADLIASEHAYQRQKELRESGATSDAMVEQAQDAFRNARAEVERARQKVSLFHAGSTVTQSYPLTSPIDGDVLARNITPGVEVQGTYSGGNTPELFTVGNLDDVWVFADVYETDLARVRAGARVQVSVTGVAQSFEGTIDYLSDMLDPVTRTARLRCTIPNPAGVLKPEMYGVVRVSVAPMRALAVARTAILHLGGQALVFVDRGAAPDGRQRFERLPVIADEGEPGPFVPVTHGLEHGQSVVVKGADALSARL